MRRSLVSSWIEPGRNAGWRRILQSRRDRLGKRVEDVYLYLLMRQDLASLNPGKAVAQGAHAANQMVASILFPPEADSRTPEQLKQHRSWLSSWEQQTGVGFGATITLGCTEAEMRRAVETALLIRLAAGITHDPTYPLMDGSTLHLIPLDTCAFILAPKIWARVAISDLELMP